MTSKRSSARAIVIAVAVMVVLFFGSFMVGQYPIDPVGVVEIIGAQLFGFDCSQSDMAQTIVWKVRLPRICAALLVGAALSIAGAVYQGLFKNPMVSPDILGASSGAGFGAALAILLSLPYAFIQVNAFAFGIVAVGLAYFVCQRVSRGKDAILMLVLGGMIVSTLFSSFITLTKYVADPDSKLPEITYWLMGSLSGTRLADVARILPAMAAGLLPLFLLRWKLNLLTLGDDEARAMGVNAPRLRFLTVVCATLVTAASIAVSGMIGWVGLVVPHLCRKLVGSNFKVLLPCSMLAGAAFLLLVDNLSRNLLATEIPIGILTAFTGAPFFLYLMLRKGGAR